jgi:hypothetical protein
MAIPLLYCSLRSSMLCYLDIMRSPPPLCIHYDREYLCQYTFTRLNKTEELIHAIRSLSAQNIRFSHLILFQLLPESSRSVRAIRPTCSQKFSCPLTPQMHHVQPQTYRVKPCRTSPTSSSYRRISCTLSQWSSSEAHQIQLCSDACPSSPEGKHTPSAGCSSESSTKCGEEYAR